MAPRGRVAGGAWRKGALALTVVAAAACGSEGPAAAPGALAVAQDIAVRAPQGAALASLLAPRDGSWQLTEAQLTSAGWRAASVHRFDALGARLPRTADGVVDVGVSRVERLQLHLTFGGASPVAAELDRGRVVYAGVWPSSDAIVVASDTTFEQLVLLHDSGAPTELAWGVTLPQGIIGARDDGSGGLLWLDPAGQAQLHTPRPFVLDSEGLEVDAEARYVQGRLVVAYDASRLTFPALLDPSIESAFWERQLPATQPPARMQGVMAFDAKRGVSVLFGGETTTPLGDTWEWDGTSWTQQCMAAPCSTTMPSARPGAAMAFDSVHALTVLFGGGVSGMEQNDTWSWDGKVWTALCTAMPCTPPPVRTQATMAFYAGSGRAVLFGGSVQSCDACGNCSTGALADTWTWNGTIWQPASPTTSPPSRYGAGMVFDSLRNVSVLFGGFGGTGGPFNMPTNLGDTWTWDGATAAWTQVCAQAPCASPPARTDLGMAFDAVPGKTVMFGGNTGSPQLADTWQWDGTAWAQISGSDGPSVRDQVAMTYDSKRARVVMFGGNSSGTPLPGTWEYHSHGAACTADGQCDTGHCVDGVCCESVCGTCQRCDQAASLQPGPPPAGPVATPGICSAVTGGQDSDSCTGGMTCNAEGQCKAGPGRVCAVPADCASGSCIGGCCDGITPCVPADAGVEAPDGSPQGDGGDGATATPAGKGATGCGCRAAGSGEPSGAFAALAVALGMAARLTRARRRTGLGAGIAMTSTVTIGGVAASCSVVTPLDQLSSQWPPDASVGASQDALQEVTQEASLDTGQMPDVSTPDAGSGTPPSNPALWSVRFGDSQDQRVYAVAADSAGDLFIAGAFAGSIDFGAGVALASTGGNDAFVAMLDSKGHGLWARSFGDAVDAGAGDQLAFGVAVDGAGDAFVCGSFAGSLVASGTTLQSGGGKDAFVVKLDPTGKVLWAQALGGPGDQTALAIAADSIGSSVVEGSFEDTLTVSTTTLSSRGAFDAFTARLNSAGSLAWIVPFGGAADQLGMAVGLADGGATYATGYFAGQANVGSDVEAGVVNSAGGFDVASYALAPGNGATLGVPGMFGDPGNQYGYAIALDAIGAGHVVLAGPFQGTIAIGATMLQSAGLDDVFVAKLDMMGVAQWGTRFGDPEDQIAYGTAIDLAGNVVVAGSLRGTATLGTSRVQSAGGNDAVLAKLDPDGKPLWIERFGDSKDQVGAAVTTVLASGQYNVVLVGNFAGQINLGAGPLQSQGGYDFFVAEFGP